MAPVKRVWNSKKEVATEMQRYEQASEFKDRLVAVNRVS